MTFIAPIDAPAIDPEALRADLEAINRFGARDDGGVDRPGFGPADMAARRWLLAELKAEGFAAHLDGAGNVIARHGDSSAPAVALGSHIDSVPAGGRFDGVLGVMAARQVLRYAKNQNLTLRHPLELIATSDEEGRFGGMFGAQALAGCLSVEAIEAACDADGLALTAALAAADLDSTAALAARRPPGSLKAFLELHIEQGPVLEGAGLDVGLATAISGVFNWQITFTGRADHSGTTPMDQRCDAFRGLAQFSANLDELIKTRGTEHSRLTVGKVDLSPNFPHTIPGLARFSLIGRDTTSSAMARLAEGCRQDLAQAARDHGLLLAIDPKGWLDPTPCDSKLLDILEHRAQTLGLRSQRMACGAGHDTQFMAHLAPAGLILVPSQGGISHAVDEWTDWGAAAKGAELLLHTALALAV